MDIPSSTYSSVFSSISGPWEMVCHFGGEVNLLFSPSSFRAVEFAAGLVLFVPLITEDTISLHAVSVQLLVRGPLLSLVYQKYIVS